MSTETATVAITDSTGTYSVTVELRVPRIGEAGWFVDGDETLTGALAKVIAGRDTIDVGAHGYGFTAWRDMHPGVDDDGDRCVTVIVKHASEAT